VPILLEELINQLPIETEEIVSNSRDKLRQRIREVLGEEARLYLQRKSQGRRSRATPISVQINIKAGLPDPLQPKDKQEIEDRHRLALILAPFRQTLLALCESGEHSTMHLLPLLEREPLAKPLLNGEESHLKPAWEYAKFLMERLKQFELTKFILRVEEDVLGIYRDKRIGLFDEPEPQIDLYWGVIGLVARDLGVSVADLTFVVLAHELGHAFTHAAIDADGQTWTSESFWKSETALKEGLAQYYTQIVCQRIEDIAPGAPRAYSELLKYQPKAYHTHTAWKDFSPEHIRSAMLEIRRSGSPAGVESFELCLKKEKHRLSHAEVRLSRE
jgi:hypothetical protein